MNRLITRNNRAVSRKEIPCIPIDEFRKEMIDAYHKHNRVISFFGVPSPNASSPKVLLIAVLADDENSMLFIYSTLLEKGSSYPSITKDAPPFHIFEREFYDEFGILPEGHPWLKPVRYDFRRADQSKALKDYPFFKMTGDELHEVAVGPVHAGIIEPGHFRFMCSGELVHHLEIQLGFQHRGVESLFEKNAKSKANPFSIHLAESIAGDSVIAHATACASAEEALRHHEISLRAAVIRAIALELERTAVHIGDLGAIANDIAYLTGNAVFGATRTLVINTSLALCGSRFGRGWIRSGGVKFDIDSSLQQKMKETLTKVKHDVELMGETMLNSPNVLARLEKTGVLSKEKAIETGIVGMAARASGIAVDVRADHPFGIYKTIPVHKFTMDSGDVFARTYIRYLEIQKSIDFILEHLDNIPEGNKIQEMRTAPEADSMVVSMVEGWRGEIVHNVLTREDGTIERYKVKDPSFHNWFGLAFAVRDNGVSDFPLVNKSFNLSYCGNDL